MARGGYRENAGRKSKWKHGKTTTIRVPSVLVDQILYLSYQLDEGSLINPFIFQSQNVIDLSGIRLISVNGQMGVALSELTKKGYLLQPKYLNDIVSKSKK